MRSLIVKLNQTNEYFIASFGIYDSIEHVAFTKDKKKATIFQPESNIIENDKGHKLQLGNIRYKEFAIFLTMKGLKSEDITVEEFDAPEQPIFDKRMMKQFKEDCKILCQHKMI